MNIAEIKLCDCANGPGMRTSVFVSGCRRHCPGCFNEIAWDFNYGTSLTDELLSIIVDSVKEEHCDGISILGGEPFEYENLSGVFDIVRNVHEKTGKSVWIYTGCRFEDLTARGVHVLVDGILYYADVIVDGPFIEKEKDVTLKFRGSRNQRIIDVQHSLVDGSGVKLLEGYM